MRNFLLALVLPALACESLQTAVARRLGAERENDGGEEKKCAKPSGGASGAEEKRSSVTFASYNIAKLGKSLKGPHDAKKDGLPKVLKALQKTNADVIALQEVGTMKIDGVKRNQAEVLAEKLGFHFAFAQSCERFEKQRIVFGNAVLSRFPIKRTLSIKLPTGSLHDDSDVGAELKVKDSVVFTTKLRRGQAKTLEEPGHGKIVAVDAEKRGSVCVRPYEKNKRTFWTNRSTLQKRMPGAGEGRVALAAVVSVPEAGGDERDVVFISTHFALYNNADTASGACTESVQKLNEALAADDAGLAELPAVLAGDLNQEPDTCTLAELVRSGWGLADSAATRKKTKIDYIMARDGRWHSEAHVVLSDQETGNASDHRPLVARMRLVEDEVAAEVADETAAAQPAGSKAEEERQADEAHIARLHAEEVVVTEAAAPATAAGATTAAPPPPAPLGSLLISTMCGDHSVDITVEELLRKRQRVAPGNDERVVTLQQLSALLDVENEFFHSPNKEFAFATRFHENRFHGTQREQGIGFFLEGREEALPMDFVVLEFEKEEADRESAGEAKQREPFFAAAEAGEAKQREPVFAAAEAGEPEKDSRFSCRVFAAAEAGEPEKDSRFSFRPRFTVQQLFAVPDAGLHHVCGSLAGEWDRLRRAYTAYGDYTIEGQQWTQMHGSEEQKQDLEKEMRWRLDQERVFAAAKTKMDTVLGPYDGGPQLLDLLSAGCHYPGWESSLRNVRGWNGLPLSIIEDARWMIRNKGEQVLNCSAGTGRCRSNLTPLYVACTSSLVPVQLVREMVAAGADANHRIRINGCRVHLWKDVNEDASAPAKRVARAAELAPILNAAREAAKRAGEGLGSSSSSGDEEEGK